MATSEYAQSRPGNQLPAQGAKLARPPIEVLLDTSLTTREQEQMRRWDALAPSQLERTRGNMRQPGIEERQRSLLVHFPEMGRPDALILDFGAGVGCATNLFRESGARVVAIELSGEMVQLTRDVPIVPYHRVIQFSAIGDRELWELSPNPILPGSADCIICYGAFQNFPAKSEGLGAFDEDTARKALVRMNRLLKPGGILSIEYLPRQPINFDKSTTVMDPVRFRRLFEGAGMEVHRDVSVFAYHHDKLLVDVNYQLIEGIKNQEV